MSNRSSGLPYVWLLNLTELKFWFHVEILDIPFGSSTDSSWYNQLTSHWIEWPGLSRRLPLHSYSHHSQDGVVWWDVHLHSCCWWYTSLLVLSSPSVGVVRYTGLFTQPLPYQQTFTINLSNVFFSLHISFALSVLFFTTVLLRVFFLYLSLSGKTEVVH